MADGKLLVTNNFIAKTLDGTILMSTLATRAYKMALFTGQSNAADLTNNLFSNLTFELAAQNGYPAGGIALTGVAVTQPVAGQYLFTASNLQVQAVGGNIVFRYAVIYDSTTGIICSSGPVNLVNNVATDMTVTINNSWVANLTTNGFMSYRANNA